MISVFIVTGQVHRVKQQFKKPGKNFFERNFLGKRAVFRPFCCRKGELEAGVCCRRAIAHRTIQISFEKV